MFTQYVRDYDGTVGLHFVIISISTEHINKHKPQCLRIYSMQQPLTSYLRSGQQCGSIQSTAIKTSSKST